VISLRWYRMSREQKQIVRHARSNGYLHLPPLHTGGVVKKPGLSLAVKDGCVVTPMPAGRVQLPTDDYFTGPAA
jgi:hypothetical protein